MNVNGIDAITRMHSLGHHFIFTGEMWSIKCKN